MLTVCSTPPLIRSLPVRERGLKSQYIAGSQRRKPVAPRAGAWIEIAFAKCDAWERKVAPRAGAWIEIIAALDDYPGRMSLPVRERGLKFVGSLWDLTASRRSPCGSVD